MRVELSGLELNPSGPLRRDRLRPEEYRQPDYDEQFDFHTVFYDYFLSADELSCILIGPPLLNLREIVYDTLRGSMPPTLNAHVYKQDRIVQAWLPSAVKSLQLPSGMFRQTKMVMQPNLCRLFDGKKVLLTKSKDNELVWIRDWAYFFAAKHGCNAILLYDNNSTEYDSDDVRDTLSKVPGIEVAVVVDWPYKFGPPGKPPGAPIWDSNFSECGILEHARHRFLALAEGVINADIDELILTKDGSSVFDYLRGSKTGYLKYVGRWIESATWSSREPRRHGDYIYQSVDRKPAKAKWTVKPARCPPRAQWGVHSILGMDYDHKLAYSISIRHFRAITTNWLNERHRPTSPNDSQHVRDEELAEWMRIFESGSHLPDHRADGEPVHS